jgi:hypothetical protein
MWFRLAERCRFVHLPWLLVVSRHHAEQGTNALRGLAVAECDRLLAGFVRGLTTEEVRAATGVAPSRAYAAIAANFRSRGFQTASAEAKRLSGEALRAAPPTSRLVEWLQLALPARATAPLRHLRRVASRLKRLASVQTFASVKRKFSHIYQHNVFAGADSRSGGGSSMEQTESLRRELPLLFRELGVRTLIDAPCGDFHWMQHADLGVERYVGIDVVEELIAANQRRYGGERISFQCLNIIEDGLPRADLIFCRDCLVHLNFAQAKRALQNFKRSGAQYLLTTTFTNREGNVDLVGRDIWRTLNLELAPFDLPRPLRLINEHCTEGGGAYADKSLGLWRLADLPLDWR